MNEPLVIDSKDRNLTVIVSGTSKMICDKGWKEMNVMAAYRMYLGKILCLLGRHKWEKNSASDDGTTVDATAVSKAGKSFELRTVYVKCLRPGCGVQEVWLEPPAESR